MPSEKCIIVGGSHAASQLAPALRQRGWEGSIDVISSEYHLPYHRPPLSKEFMTGRKNAADLLIRQPGVYQKAGARFLLGATVTRIDREAQVVEIDGERALDWDRLVLATGSRVRRLDCPGADLEGVMYLRDLADAQQIQRAAGPAKSAVIIGGGYIGLETAASLKKLGLDVTVLEALPRVLQRVTAPELSEFYTRVHREEGVDIRVESIADAILGDDAVTGVLLQSGAEIPADLVIVGIGVMPNVELAEAAGLEVDNGIVVDEFCRTSDERILAVGDCTSFQLPLYQRRVRLESVPNALGQGTTAAQTLCGVLKPYDALPWFWSDQYDMKLQIAGLSSGYDSVVIRGDIATSRSFAAFYFEGERLIAVDAVNRPEEFMLAKRLIPAGTAIDPARLADDSIPVKELVSD